MSEHQVNLLCTPIKSLVLEGQMSVKDSNYCLVDVCFHTCFILIRPLTTCETTSVQIIEVRLQSSPDICLSVAL